MAGRLRSVDFTDLPARAMLEQCFPGDTEKIRPLLTEMLAYEKAPPKFNDGRYFWTYEIHGVQFHVGFIMETPADPYSKIQVKTIAAEGRYPRRPEGGEKRRGSLSG